MNINNSKNANTGAIASLKYQSFPSPQTLLHHPLISFLYQGSIILPSICPIFLHPCQTSWWWSFLTLQSLLFSSTIKPINLSFTRTPSLSMYYLCFPPFLLLLSKNIISSMFLSYLSGTNIKSFFTHNPSSFLHFSCRCATSVLLA